MNPMEMMQFAKELDNFKKNHPKVAKFLAIEFGKGLPEGSILELKITRPGEEEKVSINFSTNKVKSTTGGNMFEDAKDKPKDKWRNIKFEKKYILDEMTESTMDEILDTIYYIE